MTGRTCRRQPRWPPRFKTTIPTPARKASAARGKPLKPRADRAETASGRLFRGRLRKPRRVPGPAGGRNPGSRAPLKRGAPRLPETIARQRGSACRIGRCRGDRRCARAHSPSQAGATLLAGTSAAHAQSKRTRHLDARPHRRRAFLRAPQVRPKNPDAIRSGGCPACNACKRHAKNKLFSSAEAADARRCAQGLHLHRRRRPGARQ